MAHQEPAVWVGVVWRCGLGLGVGVAVGCHGAPWGVVGCPLLTVVCLPG